MIARRYYLSSLGVLLKTFRAKPRLRNPPHIHDYFTKIFLLNRGGGDCNATVRIGERVHEPWIKLIFKPQRIKRESACQLDIPPSFESPFCLFVERLEYKICFTEFRNVARRERNFRASSAQAARAFCSSDLGFSRGKAGKASR